jgi:hypothetical protein
MLESNLPLDAAPIAGLPATTRSNDRVEESDQEEIVLSDDTKTESLQPPWHFISPIGRRGYRFERRFDAGWFRGEVANHVDGFGKITDKFDHNTGKRSIDRGWSFSGRCCYQRKRSLDVIQVVYDDYDMQRCSLQELEAYVKLQDESSHMKSKINK